MLFEPPRLVGHRGAAALAPENTLASIRAAAEVGARWVEIDAKLAKDGVPVLMHDDLLDRTTNTTGPAAALTSSQLGRLDAGSWFDAERVATGLLDAPRFTGEPIPTLAQCLVECRRLGLGLDLEIKPDKGSEVATAAACLEVLDAAGWTADDPLLITCFRPAALKVVRDYAPTFHRGLLIWKFPEGWETAARELGVVTVISDQKSLIDRETVARITEPMTGDGWPAMSYTVNEGFRAKQLYDWGVTGLFTDDPARLLKL
ncbi:MAG: glycerophosphoryl diester phosphodiesterase [Alphaproteobacteria bacterium]|nr:glycerophosphoryl diester phosphodiesterase [Alphaproteobacteria bacterium]